MFPKLQKYSKIGFVPRDERKDFIDETDLSWYVSTHLPMLTLRFSEELLECDQNTDVEDLEDSIIERLSQTPRSERATPKPETKSRISSEMRENLLAKFNAVAEKQGSEEEPKIACFSFNCKRIAVGAVWVKAMPNGGRALPSPPADDIRGT